jgi:hypothetical protein
MSLSNRRYTTDRGQNISHTCHNRVPDEFNELPGLSGQQVTDNLSLS